MTLIKIEPTYKKSTIEIEFFNREDGTQVKVETGWRWGTFYADVTDDEMDELKEHNEANKDGSSWDSFEIGTLTGFEMDNTFDGCWMDFRVWNKNWTEEQCDALREEIELACEEGDWFEWLETNDFSPWEMETYIVGELDIELLDKHPYEADTE
jgi:hypothetical protein